jgi:hypothetical protein
MGLGRRRLATTTAFLLPSLMMSLLLLLAAFSICATINRTNHHRMFHENDAINKDVKTKLT